MQHIKRAIWIALNLICSFSFVFSQDTLGVSLQQADSIFLSSNYRLLAASMNIERSKAQIIQAQLYPNPVFTGEFNLADPENKRLFHVGKNGQTSFQFEQLIILGGKRKSEIEMAVINTDIARLEFEQLAKELKYQLHTNLFASGQSLLLLRQYDSQLEMLNVLLKAYEAQASLGNIPLKDVVRLKGAYISLNNERAELVKGYYEAQANLQVLLQTSDVVRFVFSERDVERYVNVLQKDELLTQAMANRPDVLILQQNRELAEQYLKYQKQLRIPDMTVFTSYDQNSGAFRNQVNAGISLPLPLWNKNKGNIKSAEMQVMEQDYTMKAMEAEVSAGIVNALSYYNHTLAEFQKARSLYNRDFEETFKGMVDNFQKRNISIVEFIDFFESYNDVIKEISKNNTQLINAGEQLNLLTGKELF